MMVCTLINKDGLENYCERHKRQHNGHYAAYAVDPGEKGERFRKLWDQQTDGTLPMPSTVVRIKNYIASLAEHVANGSKLVPLDVRQDRAAICEQCEYRNIKSNSCSLCGCQLNEENVLGDKLAWAVSECPAGKWSKHDDTVPKQPQYSDSSRHLLYHIWPRKTHAGTWQRNLDQLKIRWPLFTGKRVIAVATSGDSHPFEAVQEYMHGYECEWIQVENKPELREVATFAELFGSVENLPGYTFYGQAKGVTKPINPGVSIHAWTTTMYEILLDYWPLVEEALKTHCTAGIFKKSVDGAFDGSRSTWHYSGSFCWFKNAELWRRNWRAIEQVWFGIESYPSMIFSREEAACLFYESTKQFDLYRLHNWQRVETELKQWRKDHQQYRTGIIK
jgi:hypothetical protein